MRIVSLTDIKIPPSRQRQTITPKDVNELASSIERLGAFQLPGVHCEANGDIILVWGERRYRAITFLASQGKPYKLAGGAEIPLGQIAVTELSEELLTLKEMEFDENVQRVELPWPDRVRALAEIHNLRKAQNPSQTVAQTAKEISARTGIPQATLQSTPTTTHSISPNSLPVALAIAPHLSDPDVARASNVNVAFGIVNKKAEAAATAALIAKRQARGALSGDLVELRFGDAKLLFKDIKDKTVDLIIADPPYGINADTKNFSRMQAQAHSYADTPEHAREFMQFLLLESFRVAKDRANLFFFFDSKHLGWLYETAARAAWSPFPTPLVWDKLSPGVGPWQDSGFGRSYEMIFFATKGRKGTNTGIRDVLQHKRVPDTERRSAAQKPDSLLRQLIAVTTIPGELVLDPVAGSGSTLLAARALQRRAIGFEVDRQTYEAALSALFPQS